MGSCLFFSSFFASFCATQTAALLLTRTDRQQDDGCLGNVSSRPPPRGNGVATAPETMANCLSERIVYGCSLAALCVCVQQQPAGQLSFRHKLIESLMHIMQHSSSAPTVLWETVEEAGANWPTLRTARTTSCNAIILPVGVCCSLFHSKHTGAIF